MNKYRSDADFKMHMKKLAALAFIPLVCQFAKSYRIDLRTMSFPSSHTLKANGLGTASADGGVALHLTFHLRCGMWLEDMSKGLHVPIMR